MTRKAKNKNSAGDTPFFNPYLFYKRVEDSENYKHVSLWKSPSGKFAYEGKVLGTSVFKEDERDAAKWVDIQLVKAGKKPVNKTLSKAV